MRPLLGGSAWLLSAGICFASMDNPVAAASEAESGQLPVFAFLMGLALAVYVSANAFKDGKMTEAVVGGVVGFAIGSMIGAVLTFALKALIR